MTNKEIAKEYLEELYGIGGMSSDVYDIEQEEFDSNFEDSDFEDKTEVEIKMIVLKHLDNVGAISSDVFRIESSELSADEFEEEDY